MRLGDRLAVGDEVLGEGRLSVHPGGIPPEFVADGNLPEGRLAALPREYAIRSSGSAPGPGALAAVGLPGNRQAIAAVEHAATLEPLASGEFAPGSDAGRMAREHADSAAKAAMAAVGALPGRGGPGTGRGASHEPAAGPGRAR